jgi:hypothetical protein
LHVLLPAEVNEVQAVVLQRLQRGTLPIATHARSPITAIGDRASWGGCCPQAPGPGLGALELVSTPGPR